MRDRMWALVCGIALAVTVFMVDSASATPHCVLAELFTSST